MKKVKSKKLFIGDIIQSDCNKKNFSTFFYSIITVMLHKYYRQKEIVLYIAEDNTEIETIREVTVEVDNSLDFRSLYNEVRIRKKSMILCFQKEPCVFWVLMVCIRKNRLQK